MNSGAIMTMPIRIDTLKYAQLLKESGLPAEQAELQAEALGTVLNECQVAVESDLIIQRSDLLARMDLLKQEIYAKIDAVGQAVFARIDAVGQAVFAKIDAAEQALSAKTDAAEQALSARIDALEGRAAALETKVMVFFGIQFAVDAAILFKLFA
jgi:BMFP domain-containing protein YqiC